MFENYPLGVYIPDCTKAIDFDELKAQGVKFVVARLGSGEDINPRYSIANNKRYLDLGFAHVCNECHRTGMFCIPEWRLMTAPNLYPRDYPNPAADKQIVPLQYGLKGKTFQSVAIRMTNALDSNTEIARAVSMFYGYVKTYYGKKMNFLTTNRAMFETHSPALGDAISQEGKGWPLFIVDDRNPACNFASWADFKLPAGNTLVETPGHFNATHDGMIWEFGRMPDHSLCLWMGSEGHMLEMMGERQAAYVEGGEVPGGEIPGGGIPANGAVEKLLQRIAAALERIADAAESIAGFFGRILK